MKLAKRLGYKLIIVLCIIATFCSFIASTPVHASKVNENDFYYSGTSKGSYTVSKSLLDSIIESLAAILDYLLGLMTMGFRMVFVGWTALFERCLTLIIQGLSGEEVEVDGVSATGLFSADGWITLDAIFFNHVPILDINFFRFETIEGYDSLGYEIEGEDGEEGQEPVQGEQNNPNAPMTIYTEEIQNEDGEDGTLQVSVVQGRTNNLKTDPEPEEDKSLILVFKEAIAGWYYTLRLISIMVMLIVLMYIGIKLAINSVATDKAVYKKMLLDWLVGMILIFTIHYVMIIIINFNEILVEQISKLRTGAQPLAVYEYGLEERAAKPIENDELELTLYDEVKTRAYDLKMTVGTTGMIMYMVLVYYAWKFTFIYLKRYLTVAVLVIMAPIVAASYAFNKVRTGKAQILSRWFKEFAFIVLLQSIHALMYVTFMQTALALSLGSISSFILVLLLLNFMCKAEDLFRKIFGIGKQGAGLLDEIAGGPGLKDTLKSATSFVAAKEVKNFAVGYTKGVAGIMVKPATLVGGAAFKSHMKRKLAQKDSKALKFASSHAGSNVTDYKSQKRFERKRKAQVLETGSMIKQINEAKRNNEEIDISAMEDYVNSLKVGDAITDENGTTTGYVTEDYIKKQKDRVQQIKNIMNMSKSEKDDWEKDYDSMHTKKGKLKGWSIYLSEKWEDIFDPTQYAEAVKNSKGEIIGYRSKKTEWKNLRRVDSVGKRLSKNLSLKNIANLSKEEQKNLQAQAELIKNEILGFTGILTGIPLLVAEPSAGMVAMSVGIGNISKAFGSPKITGYTVDEKGNYTFNRFEGTSIKTIAVGSKTMAREQMSEIVQDHVDHDMNMRKRVEKNHPKLAARLKASGPAIGAGAATVATFGVLGAPPIAIAAGAVAGAKFTGKVLNRGAMRDSIWMRYQASIRAAKKVDQKAQEKRQKGAKMKNDYMDILAQRYFEVERDEFKDDSKRHKKALEDTYEATIVAMNLAIEQKTNQELLRDNGYETPLVDEDDIKVEDGQLKISVSAENQLIEKALVTFAVQTGTMDISEINVDDKMETIGEILKDDLMTRGLVEEHTDIRKVIINLDSKVKDTQVKIEKDQKSRTLVEDRMAGDAIVSLMQEQDIADPSQIPDEQILEKFASVYQSKRSETIQSSELSNDVLSQLNNQKGPQAETEAPKAFDIDKIKDSATRAIQSRKASFADMAKKSMDEKVAEQLRETIKKKQQMALDEQILAQEAKLSQVEDLSAMSVNANGGLDSSMDGSAAIQPSSSEDIIKLLQLQTQLHRDKKKAELVEAKRDSTPKEKVALYREISSDREESRMSAIPTSDGARSVDKRADGSRRVGEERVESAQMSSKVKKIIDSLAI